MVIDPVCKMKVDPSGTDLKSEYNGRTYYFCAAGCRKAFDEDPDAYLQGGRSRPTGKGCCGHGGQH